MYKNASRFLQGQSMRGVRRRIRSQTNATLADVWPVPRGRPEPVIEWPIYVTIGNAQGGLDTLIFKSRSDADARGYAWVGRPSSVS